MVVNTSLHMRKAVDNCHGRESNIDVPIASTSILPDLSPKFAEDIIDWDQDVDASSTDTTLVGGQLRTRQTLSCALNESNPKTTEKVHLVHPQAVSPSRNGERYTPSLSN